jgi:hypothetical protein
MAMSSKTFLVVSFNIRLRINALGSRFTKLLFNVFGIKNTKKKLGSGRQVEKKELSLAKSPLVLPVLYSLGSSADQISD